VETLLKMLRVIQFAPVDGIAIGASAVQEPGQKRELLKTITAPVDARFAKLQEFPPCGCKKVMHNSAAFIHISFIFRLSGDGGGVGGNRRI
jgi:hypothetical protein